MSRFVSARLMVLVVVIVCVSIEQCFSSPRLTNSILKKSPTERLISRQNVPMLQIRKRRAVNKNNEDNMQVGLIQIKNLEIRDGVLKHLMIKPISK